MNMLLKRLENTKGTVIHTVHLNEEMLLVLTPSGTLFRVRVSVNGEFLHHIYPFQFLDSPEWDSLKPSEEGVFQVCCLPYTFNETPP